MNDNDDDTQLDRYLDAFGARLEAAAAPAKTATQRRFPRFAPLATTATATALAITAVALLLPGGTTTQRLDVVAEARAALAPKADELTHLVVRQRLAGASSNAKGVQPEFANEQWSATKPVRWRLTYEMPRNSTLHPGQRVEVAYADGVEQEYFPAINHLRRVHGIRTQPAPAAHPLGTDPIAALRAMLAQGTLRDSGTARSGDRDVRRLVGTRTRTVPGFKGRKPTKLVTAVQYDVDANTFAPVRARLEVPPFPGSDPLYVILDFDAFERIPLNAESEKLLQVHPKPGVSITEIGTKRR